MKRMLLAACAAIALSPGIARDVWAADITAGVAYVPTARADYGIAPNAAASVGSSLIVKGTVGNLYGVNVTSGGTAGLVMLFDLAAAPNDGAVTPLKCYSMAANSTLALSWSGVPPLHFVNGITVVYSSGTNCYNKAASATAFISADAQ